MIFDGVMEVVGNDGTGRAAVVCGPKLSAVVVDHSAANPPLTGEVPRDMVVALPLSPCFPPKTKGATMDDFWSRGRRAFFAKLIGELGKLSLVAMFAGGIIFKGEISGAFKLLLTVVPLGLILVSVIVFPSEGGNNA